MCRGTGEPPAVALLVIPVEAGSPRNIATGSSLPDDRRRAMVAVAVADEFRGHGLGTALLGRLALVAAGRGITRFWAVTAPDNVRIRDPRRQYGFGVGERAGGGQIGIDLAVVPTSDTVDRLKARDRVGTVASLRPFFHPTGAAVIGASRDPAAVGHRALRALLATGFR